eukprot:gnl/TRDRNA2_/TRDRNA2_188943_c0_seq1.p1 gnl/TRDRNA2_/TRDRNA2_188943_c0~~gnl/TRDRNA2_/TRDRNA2_188943_c0_seq1.p1  ORF type:complete len:490 (-),score=75.86 gnl/TRDRNA2_/TRDRNA2_188943_c0_seq1:120-1589(-)
MELLARRDLYAELNVRPSASEAEIRTAYRHAALGAHPDKPGGATERFHKIAFAFEILSSPCSRDTYDRARARMEVQKGRLRPNVAAAEAATLARGQQATRKRRHGTVAPHKKRRWAAGSKEVEASASKRSRVPNTGDLQDTSLHCTEMTAVQHRTDESLEQLRRVLQAMVAARRRAAITDMPSVVSEALLQFMQVRQSTPVAVTKSQGDTKQSCGPTGRLHGQSCTTSWSSGTSVRTIADGRTTVYQAQLRIKHLRFTARTQPNFTTVLEHQMVLVQVRNAINAAGDDIWDKPEKFCQIFERCLLDSGLARGDLGITVHIYMRADEWIGRSSAITSPVMPLAVALITHSRLVHARRTSWENLRAEWIPLMRSTRPARMRNLSVPEAEAIIDEARSRFVEGRFAQAVRSVERALNWKQHSTVKMAKARAQEQCKASRAAEAAAARAMKLSRVAAKVQLRERRMWFRKDLTMDEIKKGPPPRPAEMQEGVK